MSFLSTHSVFSPLVTSISVDRSRNGSKPSLFSVKSSKIFPSFHLKSSFHGYKPSLFSVKAESLVSNGSVFSTFPSVSLHRSRKSRFSVKAIDEVDPFPESFTDGVLQNMYLPVNDGQWVHYCRCSLSAISPPSVEDVIEGTHEEGHKSFSFLITRTLEDGKTALEEGKIVVYKTNYSYFIDDVCRGVKSFSELVDSKKLEMEINDFKKMVEEARNLKDYITTVRSIYGSDIRANNQVKSQIAICIYLIDVFAFKIGKDKEDEEETVGCVQVQVKHVACLGDSIIKFDFMGNNSKWYSTYVKVSELVYEAIGGLLVGKTTEDFVFHDIKTKDIRDFLLENFPGLTPKVFRTFNASTKLESKLMEVMEDGDANEKLGIYKEANEKVAMMCNIQCAVSKTGGGQFKTMIEKLAKLKEGLKELETNKPPLGKNIKAWKGKIAQKKRQINVMERHMSEQMAQGKSLINYLDPRITVAWCKRHQIPFGEIYTKTLLEKFKWAIEADPEFKF